MCSGLEDSWILNVLIELDKSVCHIHHLLSFLCYTVLTKLKDYLRKGHSKSHMLTSNLSNVTITQIRKF